MDLLGIKASFTKRVSWIEPSVLRLIEALILISFFVNQNALGVPSFLILFSIIFHHYDNLYRALQNEKKPIWLSVLGFYLGGRVLLIGAALLVGVEITIIAWCDHLPSVSSIQWVIGHKQNRIRVSQRPAKPTISELRSVCQPPSVTGRSNAEHWVADLYLRNLSPYLTRLFKDADNCKWRHLLDDHYRNLD